MGRPEDSTGINVPRSRALLHELLCASHFNQDISRHALARIQLPNITHLVAGPTTSVQVAFTLAIALKPSLTMLEYDVYNGEDFRRVSEILEDTLQGLGIAHLGMKGFRLDVLHMEKLSYASIEILALSACMSGCEGVFKAPCLPFKRLPALRRLVFYTFDSGFSVPEDYKVTKFSSPSYAADCETPLRLAKVSSSAAKPILVVPDELQYAQHSRPAQRGT
ncbi:hypothetical protein KEM48_004177 [Puccinia striiformis f. sp. tritici PST-130]|nr:hypothetical protein KEM48_004177 [Puccinia striiformis f. sp. tritici PST-130]